MIGAAPLLGLLGTVSGMFKTFGGMATSSVNAPIDVISAGISEALITTETGLVIGVPTLIVCTLLKSRYDDLVLRYRRLESQLLQASATPST
jgi:biopolymer transport protein ExbB